MCYNRLPLLANSVYDINYAGTGVVAQHNYPYRDPSIAGDVVFVKTDYLDWYLTNRKITSPITLVTGVSDLSPTPFASSRILENPLITNWIGCNILVCHPKIIKMPIGVGEPGRVNGDHATLERLHAERVPWDAKQDDVCIPWYTKDNHLSRTMAPTLSRLDFEDYMREISKHKFVVCPRGNGVDTHRVCEVLLMGSVPVLQRSGLDDMYENWPCILVDSFDNINTSGFEWDDAKYEAFLDTFWLRESFKRQLMGPRVLVLILASDNLPIYKEHQRVWRSYMKRNPDADCYFYKGDPTLEEDAVLDGDALWIKIEDRLDTIYEKTLRAFEYFAPTFKHYKCIFRPNLSSVVILDRYIDYCRTIPSANFCSAYSGETEEGIRYPGGAGYTITPDIAIRLVKERPPLVTQDDVSIGSALKSWNIPIEGAPRVDLLASKESVVAIFDRIPNNIFHFRTKQLLRHNTGEETPLEIEIMEYIVSRYYGLSFFNTLT